MLYANVYVQTLFPWLLVYVCISVLLSDFGFYFTKYIIEKYVQFIVALIIMCVYNFPLFEFCGFFF